MGYIVLLRHSYRDDDNNMNKYKTKNNNCSLSNEGINVANLKKEVLKQKLYPYDIDKIYTSPFNRCTQTADIFNETLKTNIVVDYKLSEYQNIPQDLNHTLKTNMNKNNIIYPETYKQIEDRCLEFIKHYKKYDINKNVLIVTHGTVYNILLSKLYPRYYYSSHIKKFYGPKPCDMTILNYQTNVKTSVKYTEINKTYLKV